VDTDDEVRRQAIREAIGEHLRRSPRASDTAAGVAQWWLQTIGFPVSADEAGDVLEELVQAKRLCRMSLPGGAVLYAAPPPAKARND
jgi:hypothetical protein